MPHFHDTSNILYIGFNIFERPLYRERHQCCSILSMLKEMSLFIIWILIMYRKTKRYRPVVFVVFEFNCSLVFTCVFTDMEMRVRRKASDMP